MDVVINAECEFIPEQAKPLVSQGKALLNFLSCLGYDPENPPLADLLKQANHLEGDWFVLSPIQWQATHNDAMIVAVGNELQLGEAESKFWFQLYADYLAEEDIRLHYHDAETWLLQAKNKPFLMAKPVYQIRNKSLMPELAQLDVTMYWQKFFTECQMFFASQQKKSALNGVWLWGGARLSDKRSLAVCADESFLSLAQLCCANVTLYNPDLTLKDYSILLLSNVDVLSNSHQEELKKQSTRWYWNNTAYICSDLNWFTRLWRNLTHAH